MNELKTLREICEEVNVTRRAVQGYENKGLVTPLGKNKYGHLLYGEEEKKKIRYIKILQEFGFSLNEVKIMEDASVEVKNNMLSKQKERLLEKRDRMDVLIQSIEVMISELEKEGAKR